MSRSAGTRKLVVGGGVVVEVVVGGGGGNVSWEWRIALASCDSGDGGVVLYSSVSGSCDSGSGTCSGVGG